MAMKSIVPFIALVLLTLLGASAGLRSQTSPSQTVSSTDTNSLFVMHGTFYSDKFVGRKTSSGEIFVQNKYTAAHRTLKFGTLLLVTNPKNGKQVIVRVNDRCPKSNILDLTRLAASQIDVKSHTVHVRVLPERYRLLWESQEQTPNLFASGGLTELIGKRMSPQDILRLYAGKEVGDNSVEGDASDGELYSLELKKCKDIEEARACASNLPTVYYDSLKYLALGQNRGVVLMLDLAMPKKRVETVKKGLEKLFPGAKIVPVD